jgi:CPA1 family monovalent cation:H+ antiporter
MNLESQLIGLLVVSVFVATTARRFRVPYTVAMVLTGLVVGSLRLNPSLLNLRLEPHLILVTFLPGLVFEAAYHLDLQELRDNTRTILALAIPGVLITTGIIGILLNQFLDLSLVDALLFGSLIAATDPVSVVALFKKLGVEKRLSIIVEGESLFNDGVAIVLFSLLTGVATGDQAFDLVQSITNFFVAVTGGAALGLIAGLVIGELMKRTDDHLLDIALTTILAYGTYLLAEDVLHGAVSPVIAVVVAGVYVGNYASRGAYSATSQVTIIAFWEFTVFLINSSVFLLIGLEVNITTLIENWWAVLVGIGVVLLARGAVVYPISYLINRFIWRLPRRASHVLFWGGLRGAVSTALVLSLPATLPSRNLLEAMTFGYVLFSLILQGLTMRPLLAALGLTHISEERRAYERHRAQIAMAQAAIETLDHMGDEQIISGPVCTQIRKIYTSQLESKWAEMEAILRENPALADSSVGLVHRSIMDRQKQTLMLQVRRGILSQQVYEEMTAKINEREIHIMNKDWIPHHILNKVDDLPPLPDYLGPTPINNGDEPVTGQEPAAQD